MTTATKIESPIQRDEQGAIIRRCLCSVIGCEQTATVRIADSTLGINEQFCGRHAKPAAKNLGDFIGRRCIY